MAKSNWKLIGKEHWQNPTSEYETEVYLVGGGASGYWEVWLRDTPGGSTRISPHFNKKNNPKLEGFVPQKRGTKKDAIKWARNWMKKNPRG